MRSWQGLGVLLGNVKPPETFEQGSSKICILKDSSVSGDGRQEWNRESS